MYYHTPDVNRYISFISRYRQWILFIYLIFAAVMLLFFRPNFISSDAQFWLQESKELERTHAKAYDTNHISVLSVSVPRFDEKSKKLLEKLQHTLKKKAQIDQVDSLFSAYYIYNDQSGEDSSLIKAINIKQMDVDAVRKLIKTLNAPYKHFVDQNFHTFNYFIYSDAPCSLEGVDIPFKYHYTQNLDTTNLSHYLGYMLMIIIAIIVLFRLIFNNFISSLSALTTIALTLIGTFGIIEILTDIHDIPIAMSLIVISIAMVDFLYFYYRWHVSQYQADLSRAMLKTINRNIAPAFWTSLITVAGLGGLLFIDSSIIKLLSLSVMISSSLAYFINITFLPSLLSYFKVKHPKVNFGSFCYAFAKNEMHYNRKYLQLFLATSSVLMVVGAYQLFFSPEHLFAEKVDQGVISLKVPYEELNLETIEKIQTFEQALKQAFPGVEKVHSITSVLELLNLANTHSKAFDEQSLLEAQFFMQLYDLEPKLISEHALNISINLSHLNKTEVLKWLKEYQGLDLYFTDTDTLLSSAKLSNAILLGGSLTTALILIGLIMGGIFQSRMMVLVGFIANALPIVWFGLMVYLLDISLSLELLIAMTISVGLASDATVHFAFKYFRSRYYGRTPKHSLEIMFFYAGVPVIIGSLILASVFSLMTLTQIHSLQLIGGFGAILILLSLLTDLFVLPVLLLAIDNFKQRSSDVKTTVQS